MNDQQALSQALLNHKWLRTAGGLILACLLSPITISAGPIPITLQTFALFTTTAMLGKKEGTIVAILYLIVGALGAPVFSDYSGGWEKFTGLTAGYIWAFPVCCYWLGAIVERQSKKIYLLIFSFIIVHLVLLILGFGYMILFADAFTFAFGNVLHLVPGLFIKSIAGGLISYYYLKI